MLNKVTQVKHRKICRFLFIGLLTSLMLVSAVLVNAQTAAAGKTTPAPNAEEKTYNGYTIAATAEFGWRWRSVNGSEDKYRSDLNYKPGFRTFDSNLFIHSDSGKGKYFDSLLMSNSGWGSDPNGYLRVNMEKIGVYKFNSSLRRVSYFNNLSNFVAVPEPNQHTQNTDNTMGDIDITFLPQNKLIRFNLGASIGNYKGPGASTMRWNSDEFKVDTRMSQKTADYRFGADGTLAGFDWGLTESIRKYRDRSTFAINSLSQGNNTPSNTTPPNTTVVNSFSRAFPTEGQAYFSSFNLHRTFADKLDFTGRVIYSSTDTTMNLLEIVSGRDASNNFIDSDTYTAGARSKRPQTRADFGVTYNVTNDFRISNTFTFDQFAVNGGENFTQDAIRRNSSGVAIAPTTARSAAYRVEGFRRFLNTLEGDYQFGNKVSLHLGWRYSKRRVRESGYDFNLVTGVKTLLVPGEAENSTNTLIAGMKIKPVKHWTLYWDVEHGSADNVFTRLENYKFTNYRVRSRFTFDKFSLDLAVITKNNKNPEYSYPPGTTIVPSFGFTPTTDIKSEYYSANANWDPIRKVNISAGYTYRHQRSFTPIIFPYTPCSTPACTAGGTTLFNPTYSLFLMHDSYGFVELAATPVKRVTFFAAYRYDKDSGQKGLTSPIIPNTFGSAATPGVPVFQNVIGGYPMSFATPEVRAAIRLTRYMDWNVGYQYYKYTDSVFPTQSYKAHLPFTSLRFYFGGGTVDR